MADPTLRVRKRPERAVISQPRATPWVDAADADCALKGQQNPCRCWVWGVCVYLTLCSCGLCGVARANIQTCVPEARYPINPTLSASSVWGFSRPHEGMRAGGTLLLLPGMR